LMPKGLYVGPGLGGVWLKAVPPAGWFQKGPCVFGAG